MENQGGTTKTVLITGARSPIALELARSFFQNNHRVILADSLTFPLAKFSRCKEKFYRLPSPVFHPGEFVEKVREIIRIEQITDIIPTCEEVFYFSMYKSEFPCKTWVADFSVMDALHNKFSFTQYFKQYLTFPETKMLYDFTDWENENDYIFKAIYSRFGSLVQRGQKFRQKYIKYNPARFIAQKIVRGTEYCVYSVWDEGNLTAFCMYHPRYHLRNGAGVFFEPYENEAVFQQVKAFGEAISYTGQLALDFIVDAQGNAFFIECNPRATSGGHLINTGLSKAFFTPNPMQFSDGKSYYIPSALLMSRPFAFLSPKVWKAKSVIWSVKDCKPAFFQVLSLWELIRIALSNRVTLTKASTLDIEWNGNKEIM